MLFFQVLKAGKLLDVYNYRLPYSVITKACKGNPINMLRIFLQSGKAVKTQVQIPESGCFLSALKEMNCSTK